MRGDELADLGDLLRADFPPTIAQQDFGNAGYWTDCGTERYLFLRSIRIFFF